MSVTPTVPEFDEINTHVAGLNLDKFRPGGVHHFEGLMATTDPGGVLTRVCLIYRGVRPILVAVGSIFIIPKKWREAIGVFVGLLDQLCPTETPAA